MQTYVVYADGQGRSVVPMAEQWVRGGPSWIASTYYSIDAKPEGIETAATMRGPMLQALLEDRFTGYLLVVAKDGPKLEATRDGSCTPVDLTQSPRPSARAGAASTVRLLQRRGGWLIESPRLEHGEAMPFPNSSFESECDRQNRHRRLV